MSAASISLKSMNEAPGLRRSYGEDATRPPSTNPMTKPSTAPSGPKKNTLVIAASTERS